ncbi:AAA family ATPase [Gilvimarinus sp. F26214L]|uniref:AAA family ATPase n=1 Tax=Gilvimarinus sp. DZF01 TaxID=3461371 RepID=UPI0040458C0F
MIDIDEQSGTAQSDAGGQTDAVAVASAKLSRIRSRINSVLVGQEEVVEQVLVALLSSGHVLLEGIPGLGKTLLVRALANCFGGQFKRIQFTPDLMPADITGHAMYNMADGKFRIRRGPVFTNLLLADEINRSPAKTQAALLEAMQEKQITIEGEALKLAAPFMVLATQNPIEQEGTYPLPEAELDRFMLKVLIDYPSHEDELSLTRAVSKAPGDDLLAGDESSPILAAEDVLKLQKIASSIAVDEQVLDYAVRLVRATRESTAILKGAGPRASIALVRAARAKALLRGADYVLPDDVKTMATPVMRHRIILSADVEIDGQKPDTVLRHLLETVEAPRQ